MATVLGIDEAGRGPIIGPMVMAGVVMDESDLDKLKGLKVKDSKLLTPKQRGDLFPKIIKTAKDYKIIILSPQQVDEALLSDSLNLNWLEAETSAKIINELKPDKAIIDSPSNNCDAYKRYLMKLLDNKEIDAIVEHKADVNWPVVSAASILAKVTRDGEIEKLRKKYGDFGSGYLSDPKTKGFLKQNYAKHPEIFRKTWQPFKDAVMGKAQSKLMDFKEGKDGKEED